MTDTNSDNVPQTLSDFLKLDAKEQARLIEEKPRTIDYLERQHFRQLKEQDRRRPQ